MSTLPDPDVLSLPEPPGRRTRRRVLWWAGGVLAALAALVVVLLFSPLLAITSIEVRGNDLADTTALQEALAPLEGTPLPRVSPSTVRELLAGQPAVEDVVVQAEAPSTLKVEIIEYQPVALVAAGKRFDLVGEGGRRLASVAKRDAAELPLISGVSPDEAPEVFDTVTRALAAVPADVLTQLESAGARTIDSVELRLASGQTVVWGNDEDGAQKGQVLAALLAAGTPEGQDEAKVIDVSSPDHPVTR
ncbi:cell division protein FtsQ/DivIB [Zafaria sp. Z1313]|uniref:cell division protein FtsQ/DivIB n=1 Tax=unclassified Zafaria TaxID=2828765 RepID=UPI002E7876D9|nr:FtsQ-type POTRA domain-containing protein [Zafaria sp. J156]MEE1620286.1 FtsQ-type POTRA domain-containing protein [Zafaria sp. J156]